MKINIIGAGVAGLSAGCYLQMNGFDTEIFERHSTFGGLCTGWQRKGFTFDSGLQWLLGSGDSNPFYLLWSELADMGSIRFIHHDVRLEIELRDNTDIFGDKVFHIYSNLDRLEQYMLSIAPMDTAVIRKLIRTMRRIQSFEIPPMIREVPQLMPWYKKIRYAKYLPLLLFLNRVKRETNFTLAEKFKSPFLKEAFRMLFDGDELSMLIVTLPLAFNDLKGTGYPIGGSVGFVSKIEQRYLELGGKIRYSTEVEKILTENNHAKGVLLKTGETSLSDITISAADWNFTLFTALEGKYVNPVILSLKSQEKMKVYYSVFVVSLGVNSTFDGQSYIHRYPLAQPLVSPDGTQYEFIEVHFNNYDPTLAPEGKSVIYISFYTLRADYWIEARKANPEDYRLTKQKFAEKIIDLADEKVPGLKENIEVVDIATPATFERYTNNWKGSVQGWLPGKNLVAQSPVKSELPGLKDFYFVGHWSIPGGGLPVAVKSARDVAKIICHRNKVSFQIRSARNS
ncbi:MAG: NAD(P)/FAD-dependent oxidoreductase [Bacteroidetes bacterium]|nr:NAD(P)/FAD-dependent oxidoreductase [Bacteroidota bacterium]